VSAPLDGVRVLDLTRLMPGNYCCWLLASLGADVVKIEDPGAGDYMRTFGTQVDGQGAANHLVNRAKRSAVLDLKEPAGVGAFLRLVDRADVVVESFRPGVLDRLGIGPDVLRARRPGLVGASVTGYGATGPLSRQAGHDLNYSAFAGLLDRTGLAGGPPVQLPVPFADLVGGGLVPALGIVSLLLGVRAGGPGGWLDQSLTEGLAQLPNMVVAEVLAGTPVPSRGETDFGGGLACYDTYRLADGWVAVGAVEEKFFAVACETLGAPELAGLQYDRARQDELRGRLAELLGALTRAEVEQRFAGKDACVSVVQSYEDMVASPHAVARGLVRKADGIPMPVLAPPFRIDGAHPAERGPAPRQGEHTAEVLTEAGFSAAEIAALEAAGAARQRRP
jgi:alpha-methylacyl-CoA racemase